MSASGKGGLGSTKFVAFESLAWHNECFICNICKGSMVGKGFIQVNVSTEDTNILIDCHPRMVQISFAQNVPGQKWNKNMKSAQRTEISQKKILLMEFCLLSV